MKKFRLISYVILAYMIYSMASEQYSKVKPLISTPQTEQPKLEDNKKEITPQIEVAIKSGENKKNLNPIEKELVKILTNTLKTEQGEEWTRQILSQIPKGCNIGIDLDAKTLSKDVDFKEIQQGVGSGAVCGQIVEIEHLPTTKEPGHKAIYFLGESSIFKPLEAAIIGMKPGGVRKVKVSKNEDKHLPESIFSIKLIKAYPQVPTAYFNLRVFENKLGLGEPITCGEKIRMRYTITKIDGNKLFTSPIQEIVVGSKNLPYGLIKTLLGMNRGGLRTVIMHQDLLKPINHADIEPFFPETVKLPLNELLLFEIETFN